MSSVSSEASSRRREQLFDVVHEWVGKPDLPQFGKNLQGQRPPTIFHPEHSFDRGISEARSRFAKLLDLFARSKRVWIAARFFDRSVDTQIFKRGMDAHNHPDFYGQLRQDPNQLTTMALQLLATKFKLPPLP